MTAKKRRFGRRLWAGFAALLVLGYGGVAYLRPVQAIVPVATYTPTASSTAATALTWPTTGQAAVGAVGYGILETHGTQTPVPTASTTKLMVALAVLQKHPLALGQQGPTITLGQADIDSYRSYVAQGGSVVPVNMYERITEYQALEGLLLPSANNLADSLARWAFGSVGAYTQYADSYATQLGMNNSHFQDDASGLSANTVSTASDLVILGEAAMNNTVIADIVGRPTADIPVAGTVRNTNNLLGQQGIVGIKTGNSDEAGGCFVLASKQTLASGRQVTLITAVMATTNLSEALHDSLSLLTSAAPYFQEQTIIKRGEHVGVYDVPWQSKVYATAAADVTAVTWHDKLPTTNVNLSSISTPATLGDEIGAIEVGKSLSSNQQAVKVQLSEAIKTPSLWWKVTHPLR